MWVRVCRISVVCASFLCICHHQSACTFLPSLIYSPSLRSPEAEEYYPPLAESKKRHREMSGRILKVIFTSRYVETPRGGFFQTLCLRIPGHVCLRTRLARPYVGGSWRGTWRCISPLEKPTWLLCVRRWGTRDVQKTKRKGTRVNSQSNVCMRARSAACFCRHSIGRMCAACEYPLISDAVAPCWCQYSLNSTWYRPVITSFFSHPLVKMHVCQWVQLCPAYNVCHCGWLCRKGTVKLFSS